MLCDLTHARHDQAHCLAPGLFRTLKRGERKKLKLDFTYKYGQETLRFWGPEPLDAQDMRLLQGLVALSGPNGLLLGADVQDATGHQLRLLLDTKLEAAKADTLVVKSKLSVLMREIGYKTDGAKVRTDLKESLRRMASLTIFISNGAREASFHLLSYAFDEDDGSLFVALNPRVTEAVMGKRGCVLISMAEVRGLITDPARIAHQQLCAAINPGASVLMSLETICHKIWLDACSDTALRQRKTTARKVLAELEMVGWAICEYSKGKYKIGRPREVARLTL